MLNDEILVSGSKDKSIKLWNITNLTCIATLRDHKESINSLMKMPYDFNNNQKYLLISVSDDGTAKLWNGSNFLYNIIHSNNEKILSLAYNMNYL